MGYLVRMKKLSEKPLTRKEEALREFRMILHGWEMRGLGLRAPASAERRLELGLKIKKLKDDLVLSGLYKDASTLDSRKAGLYTEYEMESVKSG